jgi:glycosyltransferase involved in cell wall biosynthesis
MPDHSFLVPAYGDSPYLRACLESLRLQTRRSPILISSSTPFEGLGSVAQEYGAELFIHGPNVSMANDWNVGLSRVGSEWVTIAHQDDRYAPTYVEAMMTAIEQSREPLMAFSDYVEEVSGSIRTGTLLLRIKKALLQIGFLGRTEVGSTWSKMNAIRFGNAIPCPAVTFRTRGNEPHFADGFHVNMDWDAWIRKAHQSGSFVWVREPLMIHRIHRDSGTSEGIQAGHRAREDFEMLCRLWPRPIARVIASTYLVAYASNRN